MKGLWGSAVPPPAQGRVSCEARPGVLELHPAWSWKDNLPGQPVLLIKRPPWEHPSSHRVRTPLFFQSVPVAPFLPPHTPSKRPAPSPQRPPSSSGRLAAVRRPGSHLFSRLSHPPSLRSPHGASAPAPDHLGGLNSTLKSPNV